MKGWTPIGVSRQDPDPHEVARRIENIATDCGFKGTADMRATVLRVRRHLGDRAAARYHSYCAECGVSLGLRADYCNRCLPPELQ